MYCTQEGGRPNHCPGQSHIGHVTVDSSNSLKILDKSCPLRIGPRDNLPQNLKREYVLGNKIDCAKHGQETDRNPS